MGKAYKNKSQQLHDPSIKPVPSIYKDNNRNFRIARKKVHPNKKIVFGKKGLTLPPVDSWKPAVKDMSTQTDLDYTEYFSSSFPRSDLIL